jgi:hypothetical protein
MCTYTFLVTQYSVKLVGMGHICASGCKRTSNASNFPNIWLRYSRSAPDIYTHELGHNVRVPHDESVLAA